uniref:Uncharacterized protein n=1 Tax=Rhizophora mucronata TaxID=61149 RepID=A0A2P2PZP6_RHIMU
MSCLFLSLSTRFLLRRDIDDTRHLFEISHGQLLSDSEAKFSHFLAFLR